MFTLRNVAYGCRNQRTLFGFQRAETDLDGKLRSVFAAAVQLQPFTHRAHSRLVEETRAVFRMLAAEPVRHENLDLLFEELFARIPEELLHLGIDQHDLPLSIHDDHRIRSGFQQSAEFLLGLLALGDVTDGGGDEGTFLGFQGAEADLDRELRFVFPPSVQFQSFAHCAHARLCDESRAVYRVAAAKPLRHQDLDLMIQKFFTRIPEELLHLGVDQNDPALPIHDNHGIRSGFQEAAEFLFGLLALGDVTNGRGDQRTLFRFQRAETDLDRELRSVSPESVQLAALPHRPYARLGDEPGAIFRMPAAESFRHKNLDLPSEEFFARISE